MATEETIRDEVMVSAPVVFNGKPLLPYTAGRHAFVRSVIRTMPDSGMDFTAWAMVFACSTDSAKMVEMFKLKPEERAQRVFEFAESHASGLHAAAINAAADLYGEVTVTEVEGKAPPGPVPPNA